MQLATAYWGSQTFLTANRLGLFALLADGPRGASDIAEALHLQPRGTVLFLNACVAMGLLVREGDSYANSALAQRFMVPGTPMSMADAMRYSDNLYSVWAGLEDSLRTGSPALAPSNYLGDDPSRTDAFVRGMHQRALGMAAGLIECVEIGDRKRLLDVGGGPGTYSAMFCRRHPQLTARVFDLAPVLDVAKAILTENAAPDRIELVPGDYHVDALPDGNDIVLMSGIFHRETETTCQRLIDAGHGALEVGGMLAVGDVFVAGDGPGTAFATLFGLNMMLTAPDGGVHDAETVAKWVRSAGFTDVRILHLPPPAPHTVIVGTKG